MAHTHEFDCKICGDHLDSQRELDQHNLDQHTQQASGIEGSLGSSDSSSSTTKIPGNYDSEIEKS